MDYVVDASVVIERIIAGQYTEYARRFFALTSASLQFVIPEFALLECANVIWKQVRFHGMPADRAFSTLRDLRSIPLGRVPTKGILQHALEIGLRHQLAIYDSTYLALADRLSIPIVTIDTPQIRAAVAEGITVKPLTDFH